MLRAALETDRSFITSSWLQSFASSDVALLATEKDESHTVACAACNHRSLRTSGSRGGITRVHAGQAYWACQRRLIERLLATCNVAVVENEDGLIDGWVCREPTRDIVHFWYVRASSRGRGVAKAMLEDIWNKAVMYTHKTRGLDTSRLPKSWRFSDYCLKGAE